jgi:hypothetical protein
MITREAVVVVVVVAAAAAMTVIIQFFVYFDMDTQQPHCEIQSTRPEKNKVLQLK